MFDPTPHSWSRLRGCFAAIAVLACVSTLPGERLVVGLGTAEDRYLQAREAAGGKRRETYVFMPGNYLAGMTYDRSLEKMPFRKIAATLAPDLLRQNYHPADAANKADLLLVVHWGATARVDTDIDNNLTNLNSFNELGEQYAASLEADSEVESLGDLNNTLLGMGTGLRSNLEMQASHETLTYRGDQAAFHTAGRDNAAILGVAQALSQESNSIMFSERHRTLHDMTKEERYFLVIMAYDMPLLLKSGKLRRVWTARGNIRSAGVNFGQAMNRISEVVGSFFGQKTGDVVLKKAGDREGRVEMGEIQIIGPVTK